MSHPRTVVMSAQHRVDLEILSQALRAVVYSQYDVAAAYVRRIQELPGLDVAKFAEFLDTHGDFPRFP
jgi:hypothetical protein